jgi:hypothetical protein
VGGGRRHAGVLENFNCFLGTTHVAAFGDELGASLDESLSLVAGNFVLGGTGESDIQMVDVSPGSRARDVAVVFFEISRSMEVDERLPLQLQLRNLSNQCGSEALVVVPSEEKPLGVRERNDDTAQFDDLESGVLRNVPTPTDGDLLSLERLGTVGGVRDHVSDVINETVSRSLRTNQRSTPIQALAGQHPLERITVFLVRAKQVSDFTSSDANIASGDIRIGADVTGQFTHELSAEFTDFIVGFTLGVKVGAALAAAHHEAREGVFEDLFKAEEFEDGEIDGGMEAETAFVRAESGIELIALIEEAEGGREDT